MRTCGSVWVGCLAVAWLLSAPPAYAEPDDAQQAWLDLVRVSASWENVTAGEAWFDGPRPTRSTGAAWHSIALQKSRDATVRLPMGERLRLQHPDGPVRAGDFEFSWSNGSGLFSSLAPRTSDDGRSLEVAPPPGADTLVRVRRRLTAAGPAEVVLFVSRNPNRVVATSYRNTVVPQLAGRKVVLNDGEGRTEYWLTNPGNPMQLSFDGPIRIRLDSRLPYPAAGGRIADSYRIAAYLDGTPLRLFDLATVLETRKTVEVDGCAQPIGRAAQAYLDLPAGAGRLELRVRQPMYLRVQASRPADDYLFVGNRPATPPRAHDTPASALYRDAARVAQDNAHALGGITAVQSLDALAGRYPAQAQYRTMLGWRRQLHTFYRDLMPQQDGAQGTSLFAWFHTPRLEARPGVVHVPEAYAKSQLGNLASGFFDEVPSAGAQAQQYEIPPEGRSNQLRIAVDRAGQAAAASLYLQLDDDPPIHLRWDPKLRPPAAEFRPSTGAAALAALHDRPQGAALTLSGAFDAARTAAPLVDAGFVEIPLDRPVRRVRVWRDDATSGPLRVALAYRTSDWFAMSESGYLGLLGAMGEEQVFGLLQDALVGLAKGAIGQPAVAHDSEALMKFDHLGELRNQWLPMLRLLRYRYAVFAASVENGDRAEQAVPVEAPETITESIRLAEAAEAAGDWQPALDHWSRLSHTGGQALRTRARSGQVRALQRLGSGFLASQLLRHDLLYAAAPALRERALQGLVERATRAQDDDALLTLRTVAAIQNPNTSTFTSLAEALVSLGHNRFALQVLLSLPSDQRPAEAVLAATYQFGWWRAFETALATITDQQQRALWLGYRAQSDGDYQAAVAHWRAAGPRGAQLAARLEAGQAILQGLAAADSASRMQALVDWEAWQKETPGPFGWRALPHTVTAHAGSRTLFSIAPHAFGDRFLATVGQPVRIGVYGPTRLRLTLRPLHEGDVGQPINDWIRIAGPDGEHQVPIIDNTPSAGLRLAADAGYLPGRRIEVLRDIPAGYHKLAVNAERHELLVGVAGDVPRLPLTVLPRLNPYVVRRVLAGSDLFAAPDKSVDQSATAEIRVVGSCGHERLSSLPAALAAGSGNGMRPITTAPSALWFAALRRYRTGLPLAPASATGPQDVEVAGALRRRLDQMLWDAEQTPQRYEAILAEAERLAEPQPDAPGIEPVLRRLRRQATWQLVRSAQESAGIRLVEFSGWQPESPAMRIRKAIIAMPDDKEQLLSGHDSQVLTLYNRAPVTIGLRLSIAGVGHRPLQPMRVLVAWDDQSPTEVELSVTQPEVNLREQVAAGDHAVRLRILEPLANQYVRIKVDERRGDNARVIAEPVQRSYMLATRDQPLVLLQRGPSRLRIDEWRDGQTRVSYRTLEAGWQQVVIPVSGGRDEALLRVFRRSIATGRREVAIGQTLYRPVPVGAPLWPAMPTIELIEAQSVEPFVSAWPDDATWSFISGLTSRRTLDDEPGGASAAQRFASLGATYRRFSERDATYYHADGAVRLHEHGAPTLALRGYVGVRRPDWPVELDVAARVFLQHVDATGDVESAATVRAGVARTLRLGDKVTHRPSLTLFQRWLSLDSLPKGDRAEIDQDIFTDYKHDHRRGLRLRERVQYRPSLDTLLYAGANLVSNEDLNLIDPDHASVDLGARQLSGDLDLGVRFKHFEYFSDDDRAQGSDTQRLQLEVGFSRWLSPHRGLQAGLVYEYDTKSGDASVALSLSLSRANGRYYQDFRPGDLDFRRLRQRKTLEKMATEGW